MIPARCLNMCLFNAQGFHITCGILVKSLCWFGCQGNPVCVRGMGTKGHKCHLVSPFSYVSISHLFEFRWRALSYEFTSVYKNFLIFLKVCGPALSKGISFAFLVHGNMLWSCMWCLFWIALLHVWFFRSSECSCASGREGWYFSSEPSSVILPL